MQSINSKKYLIIEVKADGEKEFYIISIQADEKYLRIFDDSEKESIFSKFNKQFSGTVFQQSWGGNYILKGEEYQDGKKIAKINRGQSQSSNGRVVECITVTADWYCQTCTDYYTNGVYTGSECDPWVYCGQQAEEYFCKEYAENTGGGGPSTPVPVVGWLGPASGAKLCNANVFNFKKVGSAWVGEIDGLTPRFGYRGPNPPYVLDYQYYTAVTCITIPEYGIATSFLASELFRTWFNNMVDNVVAILNAWPPNSYPSPQDVKNIWQSELDFIARSFNPQTRIMFTFCNQTGIPRTNVKYYTACN